MSTEVGLKPPPAEQADRPRHRRRRRHPVARAVRALGLCLVLGVLGTGTTALLHLAGGVSHWDSAPLPDEIGGLALRDDGNVEAEIDALLDARSPRWPDVSWAVGLYGDPSAVPDGPDLKATEPHAATVVWYRGSGAAAVHEVDKKRLVLTDGLSCGRVDPNQTSCTTFDPDEGVGLLVSARTAATVEDTLALARSVWEQR